MPALFEEIKTRFGAHSLQKRHGFFVANFIVPAVDKLDRDAYLFQNFTQVFLFQNIQIFNERLFYRHTFRLAEFLQPLETPALPLLFVKSERKNTLTIDG